MTQTIHPSMDPAEAVAMMQRAREGDHLEVTGLATLDDVRMVQAWADAAGVPVAWLHRRNGSTAELIVLAEVDR